MASEIEPEVCAERAAEVIHLAIAAEKAGREVGDLWPSLFAECGFDVDQVNSVVCLYSNGLVNGPLKLDLYDLPEAFERKAKEHEHLLHTLHDGGCFTNRKLNAGTYEVLFENEERLAAVRSAGAFLGNALLEDAIHQAGLRIKSEAEEEMEMLHPVERFFARVSQTPELLAEEVKAKGHNVEHGRMSDRERLMSLESLTEMAAALISAAKEKRHDCEVKYSKARLVLTSPRISDWLLDESFFEMWDCLLFTCTNELMSIARSGFGDPLAKSFAKLSIQIGLYYYETLKDDHRSMEFYSEDMQIDLSRTDFNQSLDRYVTTIVDACFGVDKDPKADDEIYKDLLVLCETCKCYSAIFMLLYVCRRDDRKLYTLMIAWCSPLANDFPHTLAHFVFSKWLESGEPSDMEHLLRGPKELDGFLVGFLTEANRQDLAVPIQMRMGDINGAKTSIQYKYGNLDLEDMSKLYLISCCEGHSKSEDRRKFFLELRMNKIREDFNLIATPSESIHVLQELVYQMNHNPSYDLIESALDIFIYESNIFLKMRQ